MFIVCNKICLKNTVYLVVSLPPSSANLEFRRQLLLDELIMKAEEFRRSWYWFWFLRRDSYLSECYASEPYGFRLNLNSAIRVLVLAQITMNKKRGFVKTLKNLLIIKRKPVDELRCGLIVWKLDSLESSGKELINITLAIENHIIFTWQYISWTPVYLF